MENQLFSHQKESLAFFNQTPIGFDMSDCGTGKTLVQIEWLKRHFAEHPESRALIVCPKSLMHAAWKSDFARFAPQISTALSQAPNRRKAFLSPSPVVIINTDGIKNIKKDWLENFDTLIVDESSAFKHHTSQRSKTLLKLAQNFAYIHLLSATPAANSITELWHQVKILDGGKRLGTSFSNFQSACCTPQQVGKVQRVYVKNAKGERVEKIIGPVKWVDKPDIRNVVTPLISDIVIRHKFEDCVDIPPIFEYAREFELSPKHRALYDKFFKDSIIELQNKEVTAINAGSFAQKCLQLSSGAVYTDDGKFEIFDGERSDLILDIAQEYKHVVVFYIWCHQLENLKIKANVRGLSYGVWNSFDPYLAADFQNGKYHILFAHPQSAGHGLTLTKAQATIWASPTYNLEHYLQGIKRIHRIGQKQKTQSVMILANTELEKKVYSALQNKKINLVELLQEFQQVL